LGDNIGYMPAMGIQNQDIYIINGRNGRWNTNMSYIYHISSDTHEQITPLPVLPDISVGVGNHGGNGVPLINNKLYLTYPTSSGAQNSYYICYYDIDTQTLVNTNVTIPQQRFCVINDKLYFFGSGTGGYTSGYTPTDVIRCFDTTTNQLSTMSATLPSPRNGTCALATMKGKCYIIGGSASSEGMERLGTKTIFEYDPVSDIVTTVDLELPENLVSAAAVVVNDNTCYIIGGSSGSNIYLLSR